MVPNETIDSIAPITNTPLSSPIDAKPSLPEDRKELLKLVTIRDVV